MTRKKEKEKYLEESLLPFVRLQVAYFVKAPFCHFYLALSNFFVNEEKSLARSTQQTAAVRLNYIKAKEKRG